MKNLVKIIVISVISALLVLIMPEIQPVVKANGYPPVTVYKDSEFVGASQSFDIGMYDVSYLTASGGVGNDTISSIRVAPGYKVTLYKDAGFSGSTKVLTADDNWLSDFNDVTSSIKVETVNPVDATCIQVDEFNDQTKAQILRTFAPRIWMAVGETYWASSVEWALPYLQRYLNTDYNKYSYKTLQSLSSPTDKLPFFTGNQQSAVCYSFWTEKTYNNVDLSYWQFSPYNYGKVVLGQEFGNHVGDWEHVTIRLAKFTYEGKNYVKPVLVCYSAHDFVNVYTWNEVTKIDSTHAVAYCAKGSHGMWKDPGSHVYKNIIIAKLTDECSAGTAWDTWNCLETFEFFPATGTGRAVGTSTWPSYFDKDYTNPNSLCAYRWGNEQWGEIFGQPILASGPSGPEQKEALNNDTLLR